MRERGLGSQEVFRVPYLRFREVYRKYYDNKPWVKLLYHELLGLKPGITAVDVGCGTGTFTRYLVALINGHCRILGVEARGSSLRTASLIARKEGLSRKISYRQGNAYDLPLESGFADLACCRNLLIHIEEPMRAIREMIRITKSRGIVAAVEPGLLNIFFDPDDRDFSKRAMEYRTCYLAGIRKLLNVDHAIADRLPSIFREAGLAEIRTEIQSDVWFPFDPMRNLKDIRAEVEFELRLLDRRMRDTKPFLIAGGMTSTIIDSFTRRLRQRLRHMLSSDDVLLNSKTLRIAAFYCVRGRKLG